MIPSQHAHRQARQCVCRVFYLVWLAIAAALGVPKALQFRSLGPAYSAALQPPGPPWLRPLWWAAHALCDVAACPILWWPQVRGLLPPACRGGTSTVPCSPIRMHGSI